MGCHTYSEPSGHELSPGSTQNIPYLFKNLSKSLNSLCKSGSRPQKSPKKAQKNGSLNRNLLKFLNRYGIFWVPPGECSCPDGSEYVWQRGVGSLQGRVTAVRSWPLFREKKKSP